MSEQKVTSDPPQWWVLGPALFNNPLGDKGCVIKCTLNEFTDNRKLGAVVSTLERRYAMERDFDRLEGLAHSNLMNSKVKCKILHLG